MKHLLLLLSLLYAMAASAQDFQFEPYTSFDTVLQELSKDPWYDDLDVDYAEVYIDLYMGDHVTAYVFEKGELVSITEYIDTYDENYDHVSIENIIMEPVPFDFVGPLNYNQYKSKQQ